MQQNNKQSKTYIHVR